MPGPRALRRLKSPFAAFLPILLAPALLLSAACGEAEVADREAARGVEVAQTEVGDAGPAAAQPARRAPAADTDLLEARVAALQEQLDLLRRQSEQLNRELESRLLQIDASIETMGVQLQSLSDELEMDGATAAVQPRPVARTEREREVAAETIPAQPVPADADVREPAPPMPDEVESNVFLMTVFWLVVLGAALILVWIFFQRYGDAEDGDRPRTTTSSDLGSISYPSGSAGMAGGSAGPETPGKAADETKTSAGSSPVEENAPEGERPEEHRHE